MNAQDKGPGLMVALGVPKDGAPGGPPDAPDAPDSPPSGGNDDCIPLSALNMPDENEQMQSPEVGDKVQYTIEGAISKISGANAYVKRDTINGQPVGDQAPDDQNPAEPPEGADTEDSLREMAGNTQLA